MKWLALSLLVCATVTAGAQTWPEPERLPAPAWPQTTSPAPVTNATAPGLLNGYVPDATYKLRAGDTVGFQILEDRMWDPTNVPVSLTVEDSGDIDVPYIGLVMAAGKTCQQLTGEIKAALEKDYYKHATVVLSLKAANPILGDVYVFGEVSKPGPEEIMLNQSLTVSEAILSAGGFTDFANQKRVQVTRGGVGPGGKTNVFYLDMREILDKGKLQEDIILKPGDKVMVPSRLINF